MNSKQLSALSPTARSKVLAEVRQRIARNKLADYSPYPKQREFHAMDRRERLFMAGNQLGKTLGGAAEFAMHLTGRYPADWPGHKFPGPISAWAAGVTGEVVRDSIQNLLLGPVGHHGTGFIPADTIIKTTSALGTSDLVGTITVKHVSGGTSTVGLKSYNQGRTKFQASTLDLVWLDEEPDLDIYTEALTRTNATGGLLMLTFTPLKGVSGVVARFLLEESPDRGTTTMTIDDALHYTPEERKTITASYPAHEREARTLGTPALGSGRVFPVTEESIRTEAFPIPGHWPRIVGMDLGWDHPTAAVWLAWDRDTDTLYVTDTYRQREETPVVHAAAIKARGPWIPVAWPGDAAARGKDGAEPLVDQYREQGITALPERAQFPGGGVSVEAGLMDILDRMKTGRLKVFGHLNDWWEEFRLFHRENGKIFKERDDVMDAMRYGVMMLRFAGTPPQSSAVYEDHMQELRRGIV